MLGCFCHPQPCHASTLAWIADTVPVAHVQWDCKRDGHCKQGDLCQFCDGGLASCSRCNGFEGALSSECPGVAYDQDKVYAGTLNYVCGEWTQGSVDKDGRRHMPFWCGKVHWGDAELLATSREWKTADQ